MKMIVILLTLINWLLTGATSSSHVDLQPPVLDTDGNPLLRNAEYYIILASPDNGGPWNLQSLWDDGCPTNLGQLNTTTGDGTDFMAVRFSPYDGNEDVVRQNAEFEARFSAGELCGLELTWWVRQSWIFVKSRRLIGMGSVEDPWVSKYFKIKRQDEFENNNAYVFYWCPCDICLGCDMLCSPLGLEFFNGKRILALDGLLYGNPRSPNFHEFPVVLQRVYYTTTAT